LRLGDLAPLRYFLLSEEENHNRQAKQQGRNRRRMRHQVSIANKVRFVTSEGNLPAHNLLSEQITLR
jgi:hypothetical protein